MIVHRTPVEDYDGILVKREDLCCPLPGPCFSKIRGVAAHMKAQPAETFGVLDTYHSKAGWAVSYVAQHLGRQVINFWPRYIADPAAGLPRDQQQRAADMGARMIALPAGRSAILYHTAKRRLKHLGGPGAYMMPNALQLPESVTETAREYDRILLPDYGTTVISVSSGTIAAGVLRGIADAGRLGKQRVVLHMGYDRSETALRRYVLKSAGLTDAPLELVNEGWDYAAAATGDAPFPCNAYYDLKAWRWLVAARETLAEPILFWNVGD